MTIATSLYLQTVVLFFVIQCPETDLTSIADEKLIGYIKSLEWSSDSERNSRLEEYGIELIKRNSEEVRSAVAHALDEFECSMSTDSIRDSYHHLILLALHRQLRGERAPIELECDIVSKTINKFQLPKVRIRIRNTDPSEKTIFLPLGAEYDSSGQCGRVSFEELNSLNRSRRKEVGPLLMRGRMHVAELSFGEEVQYELDFANYFELRNYGRQRFLVRYHPIAWLDEEDRASRRFPFLCLMEFDAPPFNYQVNMELEKCLRDLISQIPNSGPVVLVEGEYGDWAYPFIEPTSAVGGILQQGPNAVPLLIKELLAQEDAFVRAWCIAIIYNLTNTQNPIMSQDVLGNYIHVRGGSRVLIDAPGGGTGGDVLPPSLKRFHWYEGEWFRSDPRKPSDWDDIDRPRLDRIAKEYNTEFERIPNCEAQNQVAKVWKLELDRVSRVPHE